MTSTNGSAAQAAPVLRILHLEDSAIDGELIAEFLGAAGVPAAIDRVWTREEFVAALGRPYDLILADHRLPTFSGDEALAIAHESVPDLPFIFVSGTLGEDTAVEALKRGATDYVIKQRLGRLPSVVRRAHAELRERRRRRGAEAMLQESERELQLVLQAGRFGAWSLDLGSQTFTCSDVTRANFGRDAASPFSYDDLIAAIHADDRTRMLDAVARSIETGEDYDIEYRVVTPSGPVRWVAVRGQPFYGADGQPLRITGISADIDARKRSEVFRNALIAFDDQLRELDDPEELSQAAARTLGEALDVSRAGYGTIDLAAGNITIARDWTAPGVKSVAGTLRFADFGSYLDDLARGATVMWQDARQDPRTRRHVAALARVDALASINLPIIEQGRCVALIYVSHAKPRVWAEDELVFVADVAARTRAVVARRRAELALAELNRELEARVEQRTRELDHAQEALRQSQKLEAIGQLTGGVAHDFNNLLTPIISGLDILQRRGLGGAREHRLIDGALQAAERAKMLVQRLLAFARQQPLARGPVDVADLVDGMVDLVAATCGPLVAVHTAIAPDLKTALADHNQLEMALLNLCVNARDAMLQGGSLTIAARNVAVAQRRDELAAGDYVRIDVIDTGSGMDAATLKRAVEPFFSTKGIGKGTGLGLSMVHGFAKQLGGEMTIESTPGAGTTVTMMLPASEQAALAPLPEREPIITDDQQRGTALLVDDEDLVRESTADMLAELGYRVVEARSAEEALALIDGGLTFEVLVTDHLMPGLSGVQLVQALNARRPGLPALIISGYAEADAIAPDLPRLTKPFRKLDLAEGLSRVV